MTHRSLPIAVLWMVAATFAAPAYCADGATGQGPQAPDKARPQAPAATSPSPRPRDPDVVTLNFLNADIEGVV